MKRIREEDEVVGYVETIKRLCSIIHVDEKLTFLAADTHILVKNYQLLMPLYMLLQFNWEEGS